MNASEVKWHRHPFMPEVHHSSSGQVREYASGPAREHEAQGEGGMAPTTWMASAPDRARRPCAAYTCALHAAPLGHICACATESAPAGCSSQRQRPPPSRRAHFWLAKHTGGQNLRTHAIDHTASEPGHRGLRPDLDGQLLATVSIDLPQLQPMRRRGGDGGAHWEWRLDARLPFSAGLAYVYLSCSCLLPHVQGHERQRPSCAAASAAEWDGAPVFASRGRGC